MNKMDLIRQRLAAEKTKNDPQSRPSNDNASYPFWEIQPNTTATVRFVADADEDNTYFWLERLTIKLPFQGIVGQSDREVTVTVPCMEMYKEPCPIITETRPWWDDESLKDLARTYYKKRSYLYQGFVVDSPFEEKNVPENPLRRFIIGPQIHKIIETSIMDPELDYPCDAEVGTDFKINKTLQGTQHSYTTSGWARKSRALNEAEREALEKYGPYNLRSFLPKKPSEEDLEAIKEMFHASVNGEAYDPARWSKFYRPFGVSDDSATTETKTTHVVSKPATKTVTKPVVEETVDEVVEETVVETVAEVKATETKGSKSDVSDLIAQLKARQSAK